MADEDREKKLAAARKKLQRFQQKRTPANSPVPAKTRKADNPVSTPTTPLTNSQPSKACPPPSTPPRAAQGSHSHTPATRHSPRQSLSASSSGHPNPANRVLNSSYQPAISPSASAADVRPLSSTESLRQLSMQVNGLVSEAEYLNGLEEDAVDTRTRLGLNELEVRNQELAADRDEHALSNQQLQLHVEELRSHSEKLQDQLQKERKESEQRLFKEQSTLREQLQVHIQTIGILVSEKSDLQSALAQSQQSLKQKAGEADNLSSRLQASRQRVAELERELASVSSTSQQYQKTSAGLDKEKDSLKLDVYKLQKANEELSQRNSETSSQLKTKVSETSQLEQLVQDLKDRLSSAELRAHQLANQSSSQQDTHDALLRVQEEKADLESKLAQYNQSFQQLTAEREQLAEQFQQHTQHYQKQAQELVQQLQTQAQEKEALLGKQAELQKQITEMENAKAADPERGDLVNRQEVEQLQQRIAQLEAEKQSVHGQYQLQVSDNTQLSRLYQEKVEHVEELERQLARLQEEASDRASLLESAQGDKVTISRAMAQNKELKVQLEELQSAFVKMTNDNMEMLSSLQSEQHVGQELASRLGQQEDELKDLKQQLHSKENECDILKSQNYSFNKQLLQQATMADRVQHYEAQSHISETLQKDLCCKKVDSLSAAIRQLEMERDQLTESFHEQQAQHKALLEEMEKIRRQQGQEPAVLPDVQFVSKEAFDTMNAAMDMLQDRFASVMREKAELSERCQELEHINLQLSGETETIGEYISLYHSQRDMMKRRQEERERFVVSLAKEKEEMQQKLNQLQNLMMQLIQEKQRPAHSRTPNQFPSFLGSPSSTPGGANPINSPASPFGGLVTDAHHHHQNHSKKHQTLSGSLDSTTLDDDSDGDDWPSSSSDSIEEATMAEHYHTAHNLTLDNSSPHHGPGPRPTTDHTAQQIMELLEQIGGSHIIDRGTILDRDFAPCKCCSGHLVDV
ncbi:golgin subfamily A member 2-like [Acanthaster planci]|uniref:Golgin subfamily A member 2-like n=1 Tax=Acanthaster planci TaxID=133434 RepID=A0A8B7XYE5_ACAPL|nr:golgin subfamily A member 2-like [Acanthaster planci]